MLGEFLEKNTPDVSVQYVIKDRSEWSEFIDSVCRSYGFEEKTCPIIYTLEGTLIGDGRNFVDHVRKRFNKQLNFAKEVTRARAKLNTDDNEERMKKNRDGETLSERVENYLDKIRKKNVT
jgi:hypothetical protein